LYQIIFETLEDFVLRATSFNPVYAGYTIQGPTALLVYSQRQEDYSAFLAYHCGEPKSLSGNRRTDPSFIRYGNIRGALDNYFVARGLKLSAGIVVPPPDLHVHAQRLLLPQH
jgi:hypothetical protein